MLTNTKKSKIKKVLLITMTATMLFTGCSAVSRNSNDSKETQAGATLTEGDNEHANNENANNENTNNENTMKEPVETNTEEAGPTITEAADSETDYDTLYSEILDKYHTALSEKWDVEKIQEEALNWIIVGYEDPLNQVGYLITDIDGNGIPELLIGDISGEEFMDKMIFDLYTLEEEEPVLIFAGWDRNRYYMCSDGFIANEGSSGAAYSDFYMFQLAEDGKSLEIIEGVRTDTPDTVDPTDMKWYSTKDTDYDYSNDTPITEEEGLAKVEEYQSKYIAMGLQPFSE